MALFVRAGHSDNRVIEELLAPATAGLPFGGRNVPMRAIVVDAPTAAVQPAFREAAEAAGIPLLIDPLTHLLQYEQAPDNSWAGLPYADAQLRSPRDFVDSAVIDELISSSVTFQIEHGASVLIPPYFHLTSPDDPWFNVVLRANQRTRQYLRAEGIDLPVAPLLAGALQKFGNQASWSKGIDRFLRSIEDMHVRYVPMALSASRNTQGDTEDRIGAYLATIRHVSAVADTVAWRQGQYGLAALAAGAVGYQTGMGIDERCDLAAHARSRRPRQPTDEDDNGGPRSSKRIYLAEFGRSVPARVADVLMNNGHLRGSLVCADPSCCRDGYTSMRTDWRQHAVRSRAAIAAELERMPNAAWRLNHVARQAERAAEDARMANDILSKAGERERLPETSFRSLATVIDAIRTVSTRRAAG